MPVKNESRTEPSFRAFGTSFEPNREILGTQSSVRTVTTLTFMHVCFINPDFFPIWPLYFQTKCWEDTADTRCSSSFVNKKRVPRPNIKIYKENIYLGIIYNSALYLLYPMGKT